MTDINTPYPKLFDALQRLKTEGFDTESIAKIIDVMLFYKVAKVIEVMHDPTYTEGMKQMARIIYKAFEEYDINCIETLLKLKNYNKG